VSAIRKRNVLLIGGSMDGKWHVHEGGHGRIRIQLPMRITPNVIREADLAKYSAPLAPVIQYDEYVMEHVAMYGEGIWVGMHIKTMDLMDEELLGPPETHVRMILGAILQRDVANELGL
jgi:hypothetical protein